MKLEFSPTPGPPRWGQRTKYVTKEGRAIDFVILSIASRQPDGSWFVGGALRPSKGGPVDCYPGLMFGWGVWKYSEETGLVYWVPCGPPRDSDSDGDDETGGEQGQ